MNSGTEQIRVFHLTCRHGHEFDAPVLSDLQYGAFLATGPGNSVAYIDSNGDPAWVEVEALVEDVYPAFVSEATESMPTMPIWFRPPTARPSIRYKWPSNDRHEMSDLRRQAAAVHAI